MSDRASFEGGEGVMLIRVRKPDVLAEWTEARFEAVAALHVSIDRDAGGRLLVVREAEKPDKGQ